MLNMKADAERHLANLYWKKGDRDNALKNYKAFFQDAKNDKVNKDRRLVDNARISLGLARGTHNIGKLEILIFNFSRDISYNDL